MLRIKGRLLPWEYKVLSSAKLQMSDFSTTKKLWKEFFGNWFKGEFTGNFIVMFDILNTRMETKTVYNSINTAIDLIC